MKLKTKITTLLSLLVVGVLFSQNTERIEKRRITNRAEKAEKTVAKTNEDIDNTVASIDNTLEGAKETVKKVGDIFFGKKDKKKASKNNIVINITSIAYDDENVNQLYNEISRAKAAKKITKTYANGKMTLQIESKASADVIWQQVSQGVRTNFSIGEISERVITLSLKND